MAKKRTKRQEEPEAPAQATERLTPLPAFSPTHEVRTLPPMPRGRKGKGAPKDNAQPYGKFDKSQGNMLQYEGVEDKKGAFVALVVELFGRTPEEAEREYEQRLRSQFQTASQPEPMAQAERPLCIPKSAPELYQGKGKSGEIYTFLQRVYPYREGAELLTTSFLQQNDPAALASFRGRRRIAPPPSELLALTREGQPSKELDLLKRFGVDLSSPSGIADARKLMSAIGNRLYPR